MLKNKFVIISFSLLLFFIILFSNNSFAFTFDYNENTYDTDNYDIELYDKTIVKYSGYLSSPNYIEIVTINDIYEDSVIVIDNNGLHIEHCDYITYRLNISADVIVETANVQNNASVRLGYSSPEYIYYSNFDIYDENGNIVFQRPVLTLAEVLEMEKPVKTFQTMMSGIIPYLVAFLIGLVAFWKGWQFLSKELHKA